MDVLALAECLHQAWFVRDMRQDTQLELRIVGSEQDVAGVSDERMPDLPSNLSTHGNILQVGVARRQSPAGRGCLAKGRMYTPCDRVHLRQQSVNIS